jgi:hypothetical protein
METEIIDTPSGDADVITVDPSEYAREKGWKPKEEFGGNEKEWVDADEFLRREPFFDKIRGQSKELKKLQKTIDSMAQHFHKSVEVQVKEKLASLRSDKREAIELGDVARVEQIEQQIHDTVVASPQAPATPAVDPEVQDFVKQHEWFNNNKVMRAFAQAHNSEYLEKNPGELQASLDATLAATKRAFPDYFKPVIKPPAVESGAQTQRGGKYETSRLSAEQKLCYNAYVKENKIMSHDEYFKSLEDIGELK